MVRSDRAGRPLFSMNTHQCFMRSAAWRERPVSPPRCWGNLLFSLQRALCAPEPAVMLKVFSLEGASNAAMVCDRMSITDHFRQKDKHTLMGLMVIEKDTRRCAFKRQSVERAA